MTFASADVSKSELDSSTVFRPRFDKDGLITAIATDARDNTILMVAHMNEVSLRLTLETGIAHYWSRSRGKLWKKGETSGNMQEIVEIRTDCDQDVLLLRVNTLDTGANCHTGRKSCFYRTLNMDSDGTVGLIFDDKDQPRFDPAEIYK